MASMSPVSATTVVMFRNCCNLVFIRLHSLERLFVRFHPGACSGFHFIKCLSLPRAVVPCRACPHPSQPGVGAPPEPALPLAAEVRAWPGGGGLLRRASAGTAYRRALHGRG